MQKAGASALLSAGVLVLGFLGQSLPLAAATTILSDDFTGTSVSAANWSTFTTGSITASGSVLTLNAGATGSFRSNILSQNSSLNPFAGALTFTLSGLSMTGTPGTGSNDNDFYMILGQESDGTAQRDYPGIVTGGSGSGLMLQVLDSSTGYSLKISDAAATVTSFNFTLSGMPTGLSWTVDGTTDTWSLTLTGATFTTGSPTTATGTFSNFTLAGITSGGTVASRLAIGAFNTGTVTTGTSVSLDSIQVTQVPEPAASALLGAAGFLALLLRRRAFGMS